MMQIKIEKNAKKKFVFAIITGIAAGFLNGFLGAGSGVVLMFAIAALNPDKTDYLYFQNDKDGNLHFTADYDEHLKNMEKFQ